MTLRWTALHQRMRPPGGEARQGSQNQTEVSVEIFPGLKLGCCV